MQQVFNQGNIVVIYVIYAISLNVLLGYTGQFSVAHAAFGGVGGYVAAYLATAQGWGFLPALLAGIVATGILGSLVALPALYLDVRFLILLTLAVSTAVGIVAGAIPALGGQTGLSSLPIPRVFGESLVQPSQFFVFALIVALIVLLICWRMVHSPFGRVLRGLRDDELATRGVGNNIVYYKVAVFGITAAMAGAAGALLAFYDSAIQPSSYGLSYSFLIIAMVVIGGTGNLFGSILGATALVLLNPFLQGVVNLNPDTVQVVSLFIYGSLIAIFMLVLPEGLLREGWTLARLVTNLRIRRRSVYKEGPDDIQTVPAPANTRAIPAPANNGVVANTDGRIVLEASGLKKYFGGIRAADGLSLRLRSGEVTAIIGPNGAGKTTVFNLLTRVLPLDEGNVRLGNQIVSNWTPHRIAISGMSRSYQDVRVFGRMSALDNVMIAIPEQPGKHLLNVFLHPWRVRRVEREARERAMAHLQFVGLEGKAETSAASLPFGEQKLLALARLLATEAEVLLLDEPASGMDSNSVERMLGLIARLREGGKCVCIIEHNLHVVERIADRVYFMEAGRITAEGTVGELMNQERLVEAYFGSA
jgi:branched-chain amino acid transport system permease protein